MFSETLPLTLTALSLGFAHTLFGPDHYVPFVAIGRVRQWTLRRTLWITFTCGIGHVGSSIALGMIGIALGVMVTRLTDIEAQRGSLAAWLLIAFGLAYSLWGLRHAWQHKWHAAKSHDGASAATADERSVTPWVLFLIFVFGPCEPLIPLLMYPAAQLDFWAVLAVIVAFSLATLTTMLVAVIVLRLGLERLPFPDLHRYAHLMAGLAVLACGCLVKLGIA